MLFQRFYTFHKMRLNRHNTSSPHIISIGTASWDVFLRSAEFKVLHDPAHFAGIGLKSADAECLPLGEKIEVEKPVFSVGGGAANAAVTFARFGLSSELIAKVGIDEFGRTIQKNLKTEGIRLKFQKSEYSSTSYSTILLSDTGERTVLIYRGAMEELGPSDFVRVPLDADWGYIVPGKLSFETVEYIIKKFKRNGSRVSFNPSMHYLKHYRAETLSLFKSVDVMSMNKEEAEVLVGAGMSRSEMLRAISGYGCGLVLITDGKRGASVYEGDSRTMLNIGTFDIGETVDRTGAGDAFSSGFVGALALGRSLADCLRIAAANATSVVEHIGASTGVLKHEELDADRWQQKIIHD